MPTFLIIPALIFAGLGAGTTFSLAVMFSVLRTRTVEDSYYLSGMAQSIGNKKAANN
ncbi:MFS transporter [Jeotgalicoccus halotolerans]|uniref:MFS transporter n=2 Tax=Jeotgalicoccus halotolerans TaxID=157227 RepID=UPI0011C03A5C|nr:MFS transporter [Jeotgalicoccus halotolerans]